MEFILDTADLDAVKKLDELLTIAGVTTNPTIITKSGKSPEDVIRQFVDYLRPEQKFFVQVVSTEYQEMLDEARYICDLRPKNTYAKIPVTHTGYKAIKTLKSEGRGVLATAIYSADEAFLAALNGADYLAPYVNRMCNYGDGIGQVVDLLQMLEVQELNSKVIAASFKNTEQVHALIAAGIHAVTVPPEITYAMIGHPGTEIAVKEFSANWQVAYGRDSLRS